MSNWLMKKHNDNPPETLSPQLTGNHQDLANLSESPNPDASLENNNAVTIFLEGQMNANLSAPKATHLRKGVELKAQVKWEELKNAIDFFTSNYKKRLSHKKNLQFPSSMIANLNEFNCLQREYRLNGTPKSSLTASFVTAQSTIRR